MPDDSLIDEMREALRGDRERAEHRHQGAAAPLATDPAAPAELEPAEGAWTTVRARAACGTPAGRGR